MIKINKYIKLAAVAVALITGQSCQKDFLKEELKTARGNEFFKTEDRKSVV